MPHPEGKEEVREAVLTALFVAVVTAGVELAKDGLKAWLEKRQGAKPKTKKKARKES